MVEDNIDLDKHPEEVINTGSKLSASRGKDDVDPRQRSGPTGIGATSNMENFLEALGPAFALRRSFWLSLFYSSIPQGIVLACVALAFFNTYDALAQASWLTEEYDAALHFNISDENNNLDVLNPIRLGNGEWWYVGLISGAGFVVGLIKVIWNAAMPNHKIPKPLASFLVDIRELQAEDAWLPIPVLICSALSIGLGSSAGPEAALGLTGTAVGFLIFGRNWKKNHHPQNADVHQQDDGIPPLVEVQGDTVTKTPAGTITEPESFFSSWFLPDLSSEAQLCALDGITAAFGALFPSQILSPLLAIELGFGAWTQQEDFSKGIPELVFRTGMASSVAYIVFTSLEDRTLLHQLQIPSAGYDALAVVSPFDMLLALIMGIICGLIGMIAFILFAGFAKLGKKLEEKIDMLGQKLLGIPEDVLGLILTPTIGGAIVGMLCKYDPLLFSDGSEQLSALIALGSELGTSHLIASLFLKLISAAISLGFGFVGGQFFPLIFAGTCTGVVINILFPDVPAILSVSCCLVGVPSAVLPAILTASLLSSVMLALGGAGTAAVFLCCIMSFLTSGAFGVIQKLIKKALAANKTS